MVQKGTLSKLERKKTMKDRRERIAFKVRPKGQLI